MSEACMRTDWKETRKTMWMKRLRTGREEGRDKNDNEL